MLSCAGRHAAAACSEHTDNKQRSSVSNAWSWDVGAATLLPKEHLPLAPTTMSLAKMPNSPGLNGPLLMLWELQLLHDYLSNALGAPLPSLCKHIPHPDQYTDQVNLIQHMCSTASG